VNANGEKKGTFVSIGEWRRVGEVGVMKTGGFSGDVCATKRVGPNGREGEGVCRGHKNMVKVVEGKIRWPCKENSTRFRE